MSQQRDSKRILIIDDNRAIHDDFEKVLCPKQKPDVEDILDLEAKLFDQEAEDTITETFDIEHAYQGKDGFEMVKAAKEEGRPYSVAFVDVRMPPGWDGIETSQHIVKVDEEIQIVLCTAYSDHSWRSIVANIGQRDGLLILKKPFDPIEVLQLAHALTRKWLAERTTADILRDLESIVEERTEQLKAEMEEKRRMESQLHLAHKLESIGQLAAGVAHEINTPIQYVGDNTQFLGKVFEDILELVGSYRTVCAKIEESHPQIISEVLAMEEQVDLEFVQEEVPQSIDSSLEGIEQVAGIIRALKEFADPETTEDEHVDLNRIIESTLAVSTTQYKEVAEVDLQLGDISTICGHPGALRQVVLNLVLNAAHAIESVVGDSGDKGTIEISTRMEDDQVLVTVRDTGCGISKEIADRIYDPFFTTRTVGQGRGQGLHTTRSIVVDSHGGDIRFDSEAGKGTTFALQFPVSSD